MELNQMSLIHRRCKKFVEFIAIEKDKVEEIKSQAEQIRGRIQAKAEEDGKIVMSTPFSGSFGKKTGLRRYMQGHAEIEGMDIDIGFILKQDPNVNEQVCQIDDFERYARATYPDSEIGQTKSSATIYFKSTKRSFDLVPFFHLTDRRQLLIRSTGERRETSVGLHADFVKTRNKSSNELPGVVAFNDCLRLIKWWRYERQADSGIFYEGGSVEKVPSFLLDLLCAHAYDRLSVSRTYPETLSRWFGFLASEVRNRRPIYFSDYQKNPKHSGNAVWIVADPVEAENNVVGNWDAWHVNELASWLENARDRMNDAISKDLHNESNQSLAFLVGLFGNSFKNNCDQS